MVPGYTAISFTAGEQPTTAKWNLVGSNDAAFNAALTGSGTISGAVLEADTIAASSLIGLNLFGASGVVFGGSPPASKTGQFYLQAGTNVVSFTNNGGSIQFPTAFPTGVITALAVQGDNSIAQIVIPLEASITNTSLGVAVQGSAFSGNLRVNWIAIGW